MGALTVAVSVLMPVYNAEHTIEACLESILAQSLQDFEVIIIDDHCDDGTAGLIDTYDDDRLCRIDNAGSGIVAALNTGLKHCSSDYVARMDADDLMRVDRLSIQYQYMRQHPDVCLCATQVENFPKQSIRAGYREYMRWQNAVLTMQDISNQIYIESPFTHPSVMFRRDRVSDIGAYREGAFPEDYELWLRLFHAGEKMHKIAQVLLDWRESDGRLSRTSPRYSDAAFDRLRAACLARDRRLQGRNIVFWGAGRRTRQRVQHLIDAGIKPTAWIEIDQKKIGNVYHGAPTYLPQWLQQQSEKPMVLNYVRNHGAREDCRRYLQQAGYVMGVDFLDVA